VGPLLDQIGAETGLGVAALGVLAAVPLLAFGAVSPLAHGLSEKFGVERTVFGALLLLVAGTLLRPIPGSLANLWLGTMLIFLVMVTYIPEISLWLPRVLGMVN
jgi:CP family cyanate transporter-like MFS transporter